MDNGQERGGKPPAPISANILAELVEQLHSVPLKPTEFLTRDVAQQVDAPEPTVAKALLGLVKRGKLTRRWVVIDGKRRWAFQEVKEA